jgi:hypothetical protein
MDLGAADILGRVGRDAAVDVGEAVESAGGRQAPVDGRRSQAAFFHRSAVQLQVASGGRQHGQPVIAGALKQAAQVVPVSLKGPAAVASQERHRGQLVLTESERRSWLVQHLAG